MNHTILLRTLLPVVCLVLGCSRGAGGDDKKSFEPVDGQGNDAGASSSGGGGGGRTSGSGSSGSGSSGSGSSAGGGSGGDNVGTQNGKDGGPDTDSGDSNDAGILVDLDDCKKAPDFDQDGLRGKCDSCPQRANPKQEDTDRDGLGDACDGCDNLNDLKCASDVNLTLPYGGEILTIGVPFEVEKSKHALFEELTLPLCMPEKKLGLLRTYAFTDAPLAGQNARESWIDLMSDQYGVEGWQNEGIFIPEEFRWFYEPTAPVGGWKKQYITTTVWEETANGFRATNNVGDQLFWELEFTRGPFQGKHPSHVTFYARNPPDYVSNPDPSYILSPHEIPPTSYSTTDPIVYDSTWTPNGPVPKTRELGMVKITWNKPDLPAGMWLDLRWMDLLPPSGTELPGYLIHSVPAPETKDQELTHLSRGYGECSKLAP